jgi:hypothetical protein
MTPKPSIKPLLLTLLIVIFAAFAQNVNGQSSYETGIGIRGGSILGLSVRQFITDDIAVEGFAGYRERGFQVGALAEYDFNLGYRSDFHGIIGGGAHYGVYNLSGEGTVSESPTVGLDAIAGLEFASQDVPLAIAVDLKPEYDLTGLAPGFTGMVGGFTIRYIWH